MTNHKLATISDSTMGDRDNNRPHSRISSNTINSSSSTPLRSNKVNKYEDNDVIRPYGGSPSERSYSSRDNLKLFPARNPAYIIQSDSPISSISKSDMNQSTLAADHRLLLNNGNISSTNGRNGVALNQINGLPSPTNNGTANKATTAAGRTQYQRLRPVGVRRKVWRDSFKVIAFICGSFAVILLLMGLASSEWLLAKSYRQGLFVYCVEKDSNASSIPVPVPFVDGNGEAAAEGCHRIDLNKQGYTLVAAAFCVISLCVDVFATGLTALGLRCRDPNRKYKYYRVAVYVMALALVAVLVALVVYPVCFAQIMEKSQRPLWEFGWAYGVAWGASIFLFGGVILLLCDKESEEIYYKERTIVYADTNNKV